MNNQADCAVVSTAYCPPVEYFMAASDAGRLLVESRESYVKQTYRNRCRIYACDGILSLTVPVSLPHDDRAVCAAVIDYTKPWLQQHKRAMVSAYRTSAFFEYYQDDIFEILDSRPETLLELNGRLLSKLSELLGIRCEIGYTDVYRNSYGDGFVDLRDTLAPKKTVPEIFRNRYKPYYQVFSEKFGFIPGLSVLDLLFNEGPNAISFLQASSSQNF